MNPPSENDRGVIKVRAWITDQELGADHWRAAQYSCGRGTHEAELRIIGRVGELPETPSSASCSTVSPPSEVTGASARSAADSERKQADGGAGTNSSSELVRLLRLIDDFEESSGRAVLYGEDRKLLERAMTPCARCDPSFSCWSGSELCRKPKGKK
jgi:hypothetical protein